MTLANFDPKNPLIATRWALELPFLKWDPKSRKNPTITIMRSDPFSKFKPLDLRVQAVLGRGGMGVVLRAVSAKKEDLAVKIARTRLGGDALDELAEQREKQALVKRVGELVKDPTQFPEELRRRQAAVASRVNDGVNARIRKKCELEAFVLQLIKRENIVAIRGHGTVEMNVDDKSVHFPCLLMDYVEGVVLSRKIIQQRRETIPIDLPHILTFMEKVAYEVSVLHDLKVGHFDLSPNNILFTDEDDSVRPTIIDLGNVMLEGVPGSRVIGTPGFIAPEQREGKAELRSDQYSLGKILDNWISGDEADSPRSLAKPLHRRVLTDTVSDAWPQRTRDAIMELSRIVSRSTHDGLQYRYPDMRQLASDLRRVLQQLEPEPLSPITMRELSISKWQRELFQSVPTGGSATEPIAAASTLMFAVRQSRHAIGEVIDIVVRGVSETLLGDDAIENAGTKLKEIASNCRAIAQITSRIQHSLLASLRDGNGDDLGQELQKILRRVSQRAADLYTEAGRMRTESGSVNKRLREFFVFLRKCHSEFADLNIRLNTYAVELEDLLRREGPMNETKELS